MQKVVAARIVPCRRRPILASATILFLAMIAGNMALCQVSTGTINGMITDPQGNAVVGAAITVENTDTHVVTNGKTGPDGSYQIGGLVLGPYKVSVEAQGFQKVVETNIRLEAGSIVKEDASLKPGTVTATVEVNANGAQLETEKIASSTTIEEQLVQNAPVVPATGSFRDSTLLVNLTPGTSGSFVGVSIAGGRAFAQEVEIDGVPQLFEPLSNTALLVVHPSFDVISSVYTQPGVPAAEFGRSSGGVVTELTRSGTDKYHGNTAVFLRNTAFDARAYNAPTVGKDQQYEWPISIGGPVWIPHVYNGRNRTFFFFNWTRYWTSILKPVYATVPTLAERTGDFSDQLAQGQVLYDPTTQVNGVRLPFPNNKIKPSSAIGQQVVGIYPKPINGALTNNYLGYNSNSRTEGHWFVRLDHNLNQKHSLHGTYRQDAFVGFQPDGFLQNNHFDTTVHLLDPWWDWLITPNLLNHAVASFIGYKNPNLSFCSGCFIGSTPPLITVPGVYPQGPFLKQPSTFNFNGYSNVFAANYTISSNATYEYDDTVNWTRGKHSLKFGVRFDAFQQDGQTPQGLSGNFNFRSSETGVGPSQKLTTSSSGNAIASMLLGYVDSASAAQNVQYYGRSKYFALFAQDSFRLTPRLTLNYGIRWEQQTVPHDAKGNMTTMDPTLPNPGAGGIPGALIYTGNGPGRIGSNNFAGAWHGGWSPRVGFAYDLGHNTVVRAGYGILYAPYLMSGFMNGPGYSQLGFSLSSTAISPDNGYSPAFMLDGGFPAAKLVTSLALSPSLYNGQAVSLFDRHDGKSNRLQDNQIWQLDLQHTFKSIYVDVAYVGEVGHHIAGGGNPNYNQVRPEYLSKGACLTVNISNQGSSPSCAGQAPVSAPYAGFKGTVGQALRPFPQYTGVTSTNYPSGSSSWNGLLVKVQKQYSNGLSVLAAYTWSKSFTNVGFGGLFARTFTSTQDTYNSKSQKSLGDTNQPQNLQLTYVYDLPVGQGKRFLNKGFASYLLGGFGLSALHSYVSGEPIHITPSVPGLPIFNSALYVNIVPGVRQKLASRSEVKKYNALYDKTGTGHGTKFLNAAAFANPAPYSFGNSRLYLDHLQQLAILNENFSFYKRTPFGGEGTRYVELRAEMFNAFNRQNFAGLDTNLADNTPQGHFGEYTSEFGDLNFGVQPGPKITELVLKVIF